MNTNPQPSPEVKPAITEADVVAFLAIKLAELRQKTGQSYAYISVELGGSAPGANTEWGTYVHEGSHLKAKTADDVIEKAVDEVAPGNIAERKRAEAARLLAEADRLAGKEAA